MSSASPGATDRKPTRRAGRKAPPLRPESNTSVMAGRRVVKTYIFHCLQLHVTHFGKRSERSPNWQLRYGPRKLDWDEVSEKVFLNVLFKCIGKCIQQDE